MIVELYTDGGVRGNGDVNAVCAWAYVACINGEQYEGSKAYRGYTNNQMELAAIINGLSSLVNIQGLDVKVYSDSAYCVNGMNSWIHTWKKNGWRNSKKQEVENIKYWQKLDELSGKFNSITFIKVKGHSNHPMNNLVDRLVNQAMDKFLLDNK